MVKLVNQAIKNGGKIVDFQRSSSLTKLIFLDLPGLDTEGRNSDAKNLLPFKCWCLDGDDLPW